MSITTIKLKESTKQELNTFRENKNESYDDVVAKLVHIAKQSKKNPKLSQETVLEIEKARERIKKGNFVTEANALKRLGMK